MKDDKLLGWTNIKDEWPDPNTEVVIFYVMNSDEGTSYNESRVLHEKFIDAIDTPILYWINKPE